MSTYISYLVLLGVVIHSVAVELRLLTSLLFILRMIGDLTGSTDDMLLVAETPPTEREIYLLSGLPVTNLTSSAFTANPDLCGEKRATSSRANGSTYIVAVWSLTVISSLITSMITSHVTDSCSTFCRPVQCTSTAQFSRILLIHCLPHYITTFA